MEKRKLMALASSAAMVMASMGIAALDASAIKCCNGNGFYGHCTSCYGR